MDRRIRRDVRVDGVVQGVGFRPYVHALATRLRLAGRVGNDVAGVFVEVEGAPEDVGEFLTALERDAPPLARIEHVHVSEAAPRGLAGFEIAASDAHGVRNTLVSADSATCADCLRELFDPADRRYRYPFVNCTNCGPRFTIVRDVPYDRPLTTMAGFAMCGPCRTEYEDPRDRRFHAQPTCCPACGPRLALGDAADPLAEAVRRLRRGEILAVKGLGGYHLAVTASHPTGAATLRARKHREDKPFAVMAADVAQARGLCEVDERSLRDLTGHRRPIVLMPRRSDAPIADAVAPGNRYLGVMLPYTPLHHLLLRDLGEPIVLTSGNLSEEPIAYRDATPLAGIADAVLDHNRPIHIRTDDSVVRAGALLRRSRGYVPEPVTLAQRCRRPVLACGAELKNTFCLAKDDHAFLSHHIGDLENLQTYRSFTEGIEHFCRLFEITPRVVAHDLHPEYLSTKYALGLDGVEFVGVQHHHAHIASCLADNREAGPVIGVAFDGTGYGTDGTIWGGEFLVASLHGFERIGHLAPVPMPGGSAAIRQPWRMAAAYLGSEIPGWRPEWDAVVSLARNGVNAPLSSSAGRLFDAAAALLGVRDEINYEGQAAVELEQLADPTIVDAYPVRVDELIVQGVDLLRAIVDDRAAGVPRPVIAARFHHGVASAVVNGCCQARDRTGLDTVALSGGVFQNVLLQTRAVNLLADNGFRVLTHRRVPTNDGGISLGQAAVAGV
ncbi:hydrogenase maturation protein HypF [Kutzneria kofuensis]|uniref:Carbamoyltransferase n=1 Tax=Kutzneria kofuensis TaxID=103725 RepID=A0A7W9NMR4_9PSEU|nr:carbamoyltransferase HypF [Kutzneria kofuensis]MBB5897638.1 hydrogenase maturation protein HypF [Kutzneria kofuensis]